MSDAVKSFDRKPFMHLLNADELMAGNANRSHRFAWDGREPHTHPHAHHPMWHAHPHFPDIHHQHRH